MDFVLAFIRLIQKLVYHSVRNVLIRLIAWARDFSLRKSVIGPRYPS